MSKPGIGLTQLKVRFNGSWSEGYIETKRIVQWVNFKITLGRIFGIYKSYSAEIISDPFKVEGGWEYEAKFKFVHKYFLWIKYKTEPYKIDDGKR